MIAVYEPQREAMVADQLVARGVRDSRVLDAFRRVPRHEFVPEGIREAAYEDRPLAIGQGQTISQPYIAGFMTEALEIQEGAHVLEIGTGSGYQTAILCALGAKVCTIERLPELQAAARGKIESLGGLAHFHLGDGSKGVPEEAPFDRILVTAGAPSLPVSLASQLREDGGVMLIPIGPEGHQDLMRVWRDAGFVKRRRLCPVSFVKLVGEEGWE